MRELEGRPATRERISLGVGPELTNIEIGEISVVPELSDIWCPNSRTKPATVSRIVRLMHDEHRSLDTDHPRIVVDDHQVLLASTADRIVALSSLTARARRSGDVTNFFARRRPLLQLLPHFHACRDAGIGRVPHTMTVALSAALTRLEDGTARVPR